MEAREPRREVIEAEGRVLRDGEIETIRHRAVVREDGLSQGVQYPTRRGPHMANMANIRRMEKSGRPVVVAGGWGGLHRTVGIRNVAPLKTW